MICYWLLWRSLSNWCSWFNSAVLLFRGSHVLTDLEDSCSSFWGNSGPYLEHRFLIPIQFTQPVGRLSRFHQSPWAFPGKIFGIYLHKRLSWALDHELWIFNWGPAGHCHRIQALRWIIWVSYLWTVLLYSCTFDSLNEYYKVIL